MRNCGSTRANFTIQSSTSIRYHRRLLDMNPKQKLPKLLLASGFDLNLFMTYWCCLFMSSLKRFSKLEDEVLRTEVFIINFEVPVIQTHTLNLPFEKRLVGANIEFRRRFNMTDYASLINPQVTLSYV